MNKKTRKKISITWAKKIAEELGYSQVIIHGYDGDTGKQCITTYGKSIEDSKNASDGGNIIKRILEWPEELCDSKSKRVINDLELKRKKILKKVANGKISPQKSDDLLIELYNGKCNIKILSCTDPSMWYFHEIGKIFDFVINLPSGNIYLCIDKDNFIRVVNQWDAIIINKTE